MKLAEVRIICDKAAAHKQHKAVYVGKFELLKLDPLDHRQWVLYGEIPKAGMIAFVTDTGPERYLIVCRQCSTQVTVKDSTLQDVLHAWSQAQPGVPLDLPALASVLGSDPFRP